MKLLQWIIYLLFWLGGLLIGMGITNNACGQVWVEGQHNYISYSNNTLDASKTQEKLLIGWKYFYLWGSMDDDNTIDYGGQGGVNFRLPGVGVGVRVPLVQYLNFYLEGGYFKPDYDSGWYTTSKNWTAWEGINIYGNNKVGRAYPVTWYPYTTMTIDSGFGGEAGINLDYPLIWGINLTSKVGYRYLVLDQHIWAVNNPADKSVTGWAFDDQLDLSGVVMGVGLKYEF